VHCRRPEHVSEGLPGCASLLQPYALYRGHPSSAPAASASLLAAFAAAVAAFFCAVFTLGGRPRGLFFVASSSGGLRNTQCLSAWLTDSDSNIIQVGCSKCVIERPSDCHCCQCCRYMWRGLGFALCGTMICGGLECRSMHTCWWPLCGQMQADLSLQSTQAHFDHRLCSNKQVLSST